MACYTTIMLLLYHECTTNRGHMLKGTPLLSRKEPSLAQPQEGNLLCLVKCQVDILERSSFCYARNL